MAVGEHPLIGFCSSTVAALSLVGFVVCPLCFAAGQGMEDMLMSGNPNIRPEDVRASVCVADQPVHVQYGR